MFSRVQPIPHHNPRKRQKRAHSSGSEADTANPPPAMPHAPSLAHARTGGEQQICHHEQALKRLEPDLDAMRQLITCKICQRFLSEPYGLACGHTYCYVCLDAWLVAQKKRTCPDCRASIKQQPVPSYLIREMTRVFAYRAELLPDGETVEEHDEYVKEAAAKVSGDNEHRGLFRGLFKHADRMPWMPLRDPGDNVDRCPNCHWELEEGVCNSCGLHIGDEDGFGLDTADSDLSSDDEEVDHGDVPHDHGDGLDQDFFDEDDFIDEDGINHYAGSEPDIDIDIFGPMPVPAAALRRSRQHPHRLRLDSEPESEDSEDPENDPQMEGFLDDEVEEGSDSDSSNEHSDSEEEAEETPQVRRSRPHRPIAIDSDDEDTPARPRYPVVELSDSEDDGPVARNSQRAGKVNRGTRRQPIVELSSSDEGTPDNDDDQHVHGYGREGSDAESDNGGVDAGGFSPLQSTGGESQLDGEEGTYGAYNSYFQGDSDGDEGSNVAGSSDDEHNQWAAPGQDFDDYGGVASDGDEDDGRSMTAG